MNTDDLRFGNLKHMQTAWSERTPGVAHASWSGHLTACGVPVIKAKPVNDSHPRDITCAECGATAVFDLNTARGGARAVTEKYEARGAITHSFALSFREEALAAIAPKAFEMRRNGDSWNKITTDFLMIAAPGEDGTSTFVGKVGLAVIEGLEKSEYQGGY
ncbi:hypothetical protein [Streptomyces melanogenes]|uniref:hypothetical protein n=1 Tax=Streptomyces melanogenes TaxID=67326 RepID=UPI00167ED87D|nr:hypothetical protein [Streptomyces melanogenes]GGP71963.1 hypothetical protein GCM10010278_57450 [Streptomyces melanogenes]